MGTLTIRNLDDGVVASIKRKAAEHGRSMEEEVRRLLAFTYSDGRRVRGREWARRQLERLDRGELPKGAPNSVELIRSMREDRTNRILRAAEGRGGRRR